MTNGFHENAQISFLPVGHTKFSPDLYFGLFKRRLGISSAHCLKDIAQIAIESTSVANSITPIIVGTENGTTFIPTYDWSTHFAGAKTVPKIFTHHHFVTSSKKPNFMKYRLHESSCAEEEVRIFPKDMTVPKSLPEVIVPEGLSIQRQQYLFKNIRKHTRKGCKNVLCPKPSPLLPKNKTKASTAAAVLPKATSTPKKKKATAVSSRKRSIAPVALPKPKKAKKSSVVEANPPSTSHSRRRK